MRARIGFDYLGAVTASRRRLESCPTPQMHYIHRVISWASTHARKLDIITSRCRIKVGDGDSTLFISYLGVRMMQGEQLLIRHGYLKTPATKNMWESILGSRVEKTIANLGSLNRLYIYSCLMSDFRRSHLYHTQMQTVICLLTTNIIDMQGRMRISINLYYIRDKNLKNAG